MREPKQYGRKSDDRKPVRSSSGPSFSAKVQKKGGSGKRTGGPQKGGKKGGQGGGKGKKSVSFK